MDGDGIAKVEKFDLMNVHRLAPLIMVCDVDIEACRHKLRFVGTEIVDVFGEETTGRYVDEIDVGPYRSQQLAAFNMAVASGRPQWTRVCVVGAGEYPIGQVKRSGVCYERLVVPLVGRDSSVVQLAAMMHFAEISYEGREFEQQEIVPTNFIGVD